MHVELTFVREGGRRMDTAPDGVAVGAVRLRRWQIDPIDAPAGMFDGFDTHLLKINYELELEPDLPAVSWFDVTFSFTAEEKEGDQAIVVDTLPRSGTATDVPRSYVLNQYLNFVPGGDNASARVLLPASTDRVDAFGVGGSRVRWRHVALGDSGVQSGSYAGWVVLLTRAGQLEQRVEFSARYALAVGPDLAYRPTQSPVDFRLTLVPPKAPAKVVMPSFSADTGDPGAVPGPSVFICYAHDTPRHKEYAMEFADLLVRNGVDVCMDQYESASRKGWDVWAFQNIKAADFIVVLASPICREAFDGEIDGREHPGIRSEARVVNELLHTRRDEWTPKVLPVVLPHELVDNIPRILQPWTTDHYEVDELSVEGIDELLRAMTGTPRHVRPPLGQLPPAVLKSAGDGGA